MEQCFIIPFLGIGNTNVNDSGRIKGTGTRALNDPQSRNVATILAVFRSIFSHPPSPPPFSPPQNTILTHISGCGIQDAFDREALGGSEAYKEQQMKKASESATVVPPPQKSHFAMFFFSSR